MVRSRDRRGVRVERSRGKRLVVKERDLCIILGRNGACEGARRTLSFGGQAFFDREIRFVYFGRRIISTYCALPDNLDVMNRCTDLALPES